MLAQCLGKTLGVFGTGTIGARVIALGRALGMDVRAWSARADAERIATLGATPASKDDILRTADFISLHLRLVPETRGFLGRKEFALMKRSAILINTARGAMVEREALLEALTTGRIAGPASTCFTTNRPRPAIPLLSSAHRRPVPAQRGPDARGHPRWPAPRRGERRALPEGRAPRRRGGPGEVAGGTACARWGRICAASSTRMRARASGRGRRVAVSPSPSSTT